MFNAVKLLKIQILAIPKDAVWVGLGSMTLRDCPLAVPRSKTKVPVTIRNKPTGYGFAQEFKSRATALHLVFTAENGLPPLGIVQIPDHGFSNAVVKSLFRRQAQLALDFAGINGVAEVVAGTIGHEGDQVCVGVNTLRFFRVEVLQQAQMVSTTCRFVSLRRPPML